jgi:hypothetical protein
MRMNTAAVEVEQDEERRRIQKVVMSGRIKVGRDIVRLWLGGRYACV